MTEASFKIGDGVIIINSTWKERVGKIFTITGFSPSDPKVLYLKGTDNIHVNRVRKATKLEQVLR